MNKNDVKTVAQLLGKDGETKSTPPKDWWDSHVKMVKGEHPNYTDKQAAAAVGRIWHKLYDKKRRTSAMLGEVLGAAERAPCPQ